MKLADGTKGYIQAVIDNFSRYVLAWHVSPDYGGMRTKELIEKAIARSLELGVDIVPNIIVDGGKESHNSMVGSLIDSGVIVVTEAVEFSNSMIEMLFHRLKNRHLYNVPLTDIVEFKKQTDFYLYESNDIMPHSAHQGGTPQEAFTGKWGLDNISQIKAQSAKAREERFEINISLSCKSCEIT
jgi:transposase InsO family protein